MLRASAALAATAVLLGACASTPAPLKFAEGTAPPAEFLWSRSDEPYLARLRAEYRLEDVIAGAVSDEERVRRLTHWAHTRWQHSTYRQPKKWDPISILEQARQGDQFRCAEYSIVLAGALNAVGIPARPLGLHSDSALRNLFGITHVVTEAYLRDRGKWVLADGQFDIVPAVGEVPLNAVELQQAIAARRPGLAADSAYARAAGVTYTDWIAPYLYHLETRLDQRYDTARSDRFLVLLPVDAKPDAVGGRERVFTSSAATFYPPVAR